MRQKVILCLLLSILFLPGLFSSENNPLSKPEGKLTYISVFKVRDEKGNQFKFCENFLIGKISASFLYVFTRTEKNTISFTQYMNYGQNFINYLNAGIGYAVDSAVFGFLIPVYVVLMYNLTGIIIYGLSAGLFSVMSIMYFIRSAYYCVQAKTALLNMIRDYNQNVTEKDSANNNARLEIFSLAL